MNAGALQPAMVRQLTTPLPCSPPTIKPALVSFGITAMHFACLSKEDGICWAEVMFCSTCAAASSSFAASTAQTSDANTTTNALTEKTFLIGNLLIRHGSDDASCLLGCPAPHASPTPPARPRVCVRPVRGRNPKSTVAELKRFLK